MRINAILLKPLDGDAPGTPRTFDKGDFDRLRAMSAVREAGDDDAVEPPKDEDAELLERLRHPVDGPKVLGELKAGMEGYRREMSDLREQLGDARAATSAAEAARDEAVAEAVTFRNQVDELRAAQIDAPAVGTDPAPVPAPAPAPPPRGRQQRGEG